MIVIKSTTALTRKPISQSLSQISKPANQTIAGKTVSVGLTIMSVNHKLGPIPCAEVPADNIKIYLISARGKLGRGKMREHAGSPSLSLSYRPPCALPHLSPVLLVTHNPPFPCDTKRPVREEERAHSMSVSCRTNEPVSHQ